MVSFTISGIEPRHDPLWLLGGERLRRLFYEELIRVVKRLKAAELAAGLDRHGRPMRRIAAATARDRTADVNPVTGQSPYSPMGRADASLPPLQSTGSLSRTRTLFRGRVTAKGAQFYWADDPWTGRNWGDILKRHAQGFYQKFRNGWAYVPPRDVIGLSPQSLALAERHMNRWWKARRALEPFVGDNGSALTLPVPAQPVPAPAVPRRAKTPRLPRFQTLPTPHVRTYHTKAPVAVPEGVMRGARRYLVR
jgi:hypothetical protein